MQSPIQDKPKEEHTKTHINQIDKNQRKQEISKATKEKQQITYKGIPIRLSTDFSAKTLHARREWYNIFKVIEEKNLQPRILYLTRHSFKFDREIKALETSKS